MDLCATPAVELARLIRSRELSATELLTAVLARIEDTQSKMHEVMRAVVMPRTDRSDV